MKRRDLLKSLAAIPFVGRMFGKSARAVDVVPDASWQAPPVVHEPTKCVRHWPISTIKNLSFERRFLCDGYHQFVYFAENNDGEVRVIMNSPISVDADDGERMIRVGWRKDEMQVQALHEYRYIGCSFGEFRSVSNAFHDMLADRYALQYIESGGPINKFYQVL